MNTDYVIALARDAMMTLIMVGAPVILVSLGVGLVISIIQATTQIQEQTLTFVPKILAVLAVLAFMGPWMLRTLMDFTLRLFQQVPGLIR